MFALGNEPFTKSYFSELLEEEREKIREEMKQTNYVAVTTDLWSSKANSSFTGLTGHFWSNKREAHVSKQLDCARFQGSHTSEAIKAELTKMLSDFNISD